MGAGVVVVARGALDCSRGEGGMSWGGREVGIWAEDGQDTLVMEKQEISGSQAPSGVPTFPSQARI